MKAFCITLTGNDYSQRSAVRCIQSAAQGGLEVEPWEAVPAERAELVMAAAGLRWTWARLNTSDDVCPVTGLKQHPYKTKDWRMRIGCAMSHYQLWDYCVQLREPILILEHDAVFLRAVPPIPFVYGAIMLNDPAGATPRGSWWSRSIADKGPGIRPKTVVFDDGRPDGLAGNSAYIIAPHTAAAAIAAYQHLGVWPNDATLCRQIVGGLYEIYPFVTAVAAQKTMAEGY